MCSRVIRTGKRLDNDDTVLLMIINIVKKSLDECTVILFSCPLLCERYSVVATNVAPYYERGAAKNFELNFLLVSPWIPSVILYGIIQSFGIKFATSGATTFLSRE